MPQAVRVHEHELDRKSLSSEFRLINTDPLRQLRLEWSEMMRGRKAPDNDLSSFEKGIDFMLHFGKRRFSCHDVMERYSISYRQAQRLLSQVGRLLPMLPDGFSEDSVRSRFMWRIR